MTNHTPTPWLADSLDIQGANKKWIGSMTQVLGESSDIGEANALHIVACVNACAGINPEAVKDLRSVLTNALEWWGVGRPAPAWVIDAQAALAKAKLP